jgi:hypothetical protein
MEATMKFALSSLVFLAGLFSASETKAQCTGGEVSVRNGYVINDLTNLDDHELALYVMGFVNGILSSTMAGTSNSCLDVIYECIRDRTSGQLAVVVRKYLTDNPGEWHDGNNILIWNAIFSPCSRRIHKTAWTQDIPTGTCPGLASACP